MEKKKALELWDAIYGKNSYWQPDCFGAWMYRNDYADQDTKRVTPNGGKAYNCGWEIDHIRPRCSFKSDAESDFLNNYEPINFINNRCKSDKFPHFKIDENTYRIVKCDICSKNGFKGYGIIDEDGNRIDWKGRTNCFFKTNK